MRRLLLILCLMLAACGAPDAPTVTRTDLIAYGQTVEGNFDGPHQQHRWTFVGQAGDVLDVALQPQGIRPDFALLGPDGSAVEVVSSAAYRDSAVLENVALAAAGQYTLALTLADGSGRYTLTLAADPAAEAALSAPTRTPVATVLPATATATPTTTPTPTPMPTVSPTAAPEVITTGAQLEPFRLYMAELTQPGQFDRFTLFGQAGEVITVGAFRPPGGNVDPYLELHSPAGDILATANNTLGSPDAILFGLEVPATGAYSIFVRDELAQVTGRYELAFGYGLSLADRPQNATTAEQVYNGDLLRPGFRDAWTLDLRLGDVISAAAAVSDASTLDPLLELIAPSGEVIRSDDNSGGGRSAALRQVVAPQTGRYTLAVGGASAEAALGPYTLLWRYEAQAPTPAPSLTPIPSPTPFTYADETVTLSEGSLATLVFVGAAGDVVEITAAGLTAGFDPLLEVYGPEGDLLAEADDSDGDLNPRLTLTLPASGAYTVQVRDYIYAPGTFRFTVIAAGEG